jgi:alkylhydroperoxidase/carboxymuconolactone decarboxylase family protein YurZ
MLKAFAPAFAKHQMEEKALLFDHENDQAVPEKYKLLAGITAAAALNAETCTQMWVRQAKTARIANTEITDARKLANQRSTKIK